MAEPFLIVARYNEPEWKMPELDLQVVQKGIHLENVGREASSYHWWLKENYYRIQGERTYCFLQGDPWAHGIHPRNFREVSRFTPLGTYRVECEWDGSPHHPGLPLDRLWDKWDISDVKPERLRFVSGANFLVPGWNILDRPLSWYERMYGEMMSPFEPEAPWCMERFWPYVWRTA